MLKIKLFVVAGVLSLVGLVLSGAPQFSASAETDVLGEIAKYKTWSKMTKEPIKVEFKIDDLSGGG